MQFQLNKVPWATVVVVCVVVIAVTVLVVTNHANSGVITVLVGLLPPLAVGAGFAERNSRDIRNGTITDKVIEGTTKVLNDTGVTQVAQQAQSATQLSMDALSQILNNQVAVHPHLAQPVKEPPNGG